MKFTISDCISRINQALNYPSISYEDVSHFFDQAIAELNTSLRIALPTVTEMRLENTFKVSDSPNVVVISKARDNPVSSVSEVPEEAPVDGIVPVVYYVGGTRLDRAFYIWKGTKWEKVDKVYGLVPGGDSAFELIAVDYTYAVWHEIPMERVVEFSLTDYLTTDWIILFLIPYVCFKFAVRNGDNGALFSDEFTQGFQQLQTSYGVPNSVALNTVAHLPAYRKLATENLNDLRKKVPTRAITGDMRIPNGVKTVHCNNLFDHGGWGI